MKDNHKIITSIDPSSIDETLVAEIKAAPITSEIFPVSGLEEFNGTILKADQIVLESGAKLFLTNISSKYIAIVCNRLRFRAPEKRAVISRIMSVFPPSADNIAQIPGTPPDQPKTGGTGYTGTSGYPGYPGNPGNTLQLPIILLICGKLENMAPNPLPDFINLKINFLGIDGGLGGKGGQGGKGGRGGSGGDGEDDWWTGTCKGGPFDGGPGGTSGQGGKGGVGGTGGNGADIYFIGNEDVIDYLSFSGVNNQAGTGGEGGHPGEVGSVGDGGPRGGRTNFCNGGAKGGKGRHPSVSNLGRGSEGSNGAKGSTQSVLRQIEDFY